MPSFALLLRCLLIVTLCLDGSLSLWSSSAMAANQARHAAASVTAPALAEADDAECADTSEGAGSQPGRPGAAHEDCDCGVGTCGCPCLFSVAATITHAVPFMALHTLATQPVMPSPSHVPLNTRTAVFRPPIG
jgi:hypothetical protein